jgi:large subunit ribosomal protein L2
MTLKKYKPTTPTLRERVSIDYKKDNIWPNRPVKSCVTRKANIGGRNNKGRIATFHKGGGHKRLYRFIDFKRSVLDLEGYVIRLEYDPNRSSYIALIAYPDGQLCYILAAQGLKAGDKVISSFDIDTAIRLGNSLPLKHVPVGTFIHNIELKPGKGGQIVRSAGTSAKIIKKEKDKCVLRLTSGQELTLSNLCLCTIGILSNINHNNVVIGKAGRSRWLNKKPTVRGVVMNPVDHPHGGGEGKTSGGRCSVTPWGIPTKGYKTNRKKSKQRK